MLSMLTRVSRHALKSQAAPCVSVACKHTLPSLPYEYKALEPIISEEIMTLHHTKHHQTYVNNLNVAEEQLAEAVANEDTTKIISLAPSLNFNGGGHINHSIFWTNLSPNGGGEPTGDLLAAIIRDYGSFENMKKNLVAASVGVQGSGWGWLGYDKKTQMLTIDSMANQNALLATTGHVPLLGIDVWEHAYYLQYKNVRPDYVNAVFDIINWEDVSARYQEAM